MMTTTDTRVTEIARFTIQVYAALSHLPEPTRTELIDDLPAHLTEITTDTSSPLEELLGTPRAYADELCASAGLPVAGAGTGSGGRPAKAPQLDLRTGGRPGHPRPLDFLSGLKLAWWVVRGVVLSIFVVGLLLAYFNSGPGGVFWLIPGVPAGVFLSVLLGRIQASLPIPVRAAVIAGNTVLLALGTLAFVAMPTGPVGFH